MLGSRGKGIAKLKNCQVWLCCYQHAHFSFLKELLLSTKK